MSSPLRTCLGCRSVRDKKALVRFTAVGGVLRIDLKGSVGGRGAYVCPALICVRQALGKNDAFGRALRTKVKTQTAEEVWASLKDPLNL